MGKDNFPTKEDLAYVSLNNYLFEHYLAKTGIPVIAFMMSISESSKAEIKRPELLLELEKSVRDGGMNLPGRQRRTIDKPRVRTAKMRYGRFGKYVKRWDMEDGA